MSGMVSESLRFGLPAFGGKEDFKLCYYVLQKCKIKNKEYDGILMWALSKSITIMQKNRDILDMLVEKMKSEAKIIELFEIIENN